MGHGSNGGRVLNCQSIGRWRIALDLPVDLLEGAALVPFFFRVAVVPLLWLVVLLFPSVFLVALVLPAASCAVNLVSNLVPDRAGDVTLSKPSA